MSHIAPTENQGNDVEAVEKLHRHYQELNEQMKGVIVGMDDVIEQLLIIILCRGHGNVSRILCRDISRIVSTAEEMAESTGANCRQ